MADSLDTVDYVVIGIYFIAVLCVGIWTIKVQTHCDINKDNQSTNTLRYQQRQSKYKQTEISTKTIKVQPHCDINKDNQRDINKDQPSTNTLRYQQRPLKYKHTVISTKTIKVQTQQSKYKHTAISTKTIKEQKHCDINKDNQSTDTLCYQQRQSKYKHTEISTKTIKVQTHCDINKDNQSTNTVGASIYASNIGAPMFIGLAGTAAASGLAVTIYEWIAVYFLVALGWVFLPVYISSGVFTMPEYLRKRFGGKRIRLFSSLFALIGFIVFNISVRILKCIRMKYYHNLIRDILGLNEVGGWSGMATKYMTSIANQTFNNQSYQECGKPREDSFHILRSPVSGDIPWTGAFTGLSFLGLYVWSQDQLIVQRTLSAKNMVHAKAATLFACVLKLTGLLLFIIPGMISRILYTDEIACADPKSCDEFCNNKAGCSNFAYPLLVIRLLPKGLRGLMLAALLAALMSSMTSILNSGSSIMTMDIWRQFRKQAPQSELMIVGRLTVLVLVVLSVLWLPILKTAEEGIIWFYMQAIRSYLIPPMCVLFILGLFWKRLTEQGAFWGLILGLIVGIIRMILDFSFRAPLCGSGDPDNRPAVVSKVDFLHFAAILGLVTTGAMILISMFTEPRPDRKLKRVTWWTRNDEDEPELSSDEEEDFGFDSEKEQRQPAETLNNVKCQMLQKCKDWICGTIKEPKCKLSPEEKRLLRKKMTSLSEKTRNRRILNCAAVVITIGTTVLIAVFH
ncbi:SLC5A9 [Mytilus coruscus]|uniref:SLC5A9 n=1 Tax=Mytilus coruscus TaxID=42192 RepID=A0A6J8CYH7_MYTCO|nr:SLC5A9 [Mytilus coruscus]